MEIRRLFLIASLILLAATARALDFTSLKPRNPIPTPNHLKSVRVLNGAWFTAGEFGALAARSPAGSWAARDSATTLNLSALAFGNGAYLAATIESRTILRSTDGVAWTRLTPANAPNENYALIFANGKFWTAGGNDGVGSSADGITWTKTAIAGAPQLSSIAFGAGRYVAVAGDGYITTSTDGTNWTPALQGVPGKTGLDDDFKMVRFVNNRFLAGGAQGLLLVSTDGLIWSAPINVGVVDWFFDAAYFNGTYYLPGRQGKVSYSADLVVWHQSETGFLGTMYSVDTDGTRLIVVGDNGTIASSTDGLNWASETQGAQEYFYDVTYGLGQFAAADAGGGIWTSPDTIAWTRVFNDASAGFVGMHSAGGRLVGVTFAGKAIVSINGMSWNSNTIAANVSISRSRLLQNQVWAVGNNGLVAFSANGESWTTATAGSQTLNDIAFGAGLYVVVGEQGTILTSPNGTTWTPRAIGTTDRLISVAYGAGKFVALSSTFGVAWRSVDGITWTNTGFSSLPFNGRGLFFEDGGFIALAPFQGPSTSADGLSWTSLNPISSSSPLGLLLSNGRLVLVGTFGLIMSSDENARLTLTPAGGGQAGLSWTGSGFTLKTSTDPATGWGNAPSQSNPQTIQLNELKRFFRLER